MGVFTCGKRVIYDTEGKMRVKAACKKKKRPCSKCGSDGYAQHLHLYTYWKKKKLFRYKVQLIKFVLPLLLSFSIFCTILNSKDIEDKIIEHWWTANSLLLEPLGSFIKERSMFWRYLAHLLPGPVSLCTMHLAQMSGQGFGSTRLWWKSIHTTRNTSGRDWTLS